jgi:hypothetical protein
VATLPSNPVFKHAMHGIQRHATPPPPVSRFVVLSFLLHVLLVLLFGDATGAKQGTTLWGSFVATLQSPARTPQPAASAGGATLIDRLVPAPTSPTSKPATTASLRESKPGASQGQATAPASATPPSSAAPEKAAPAPTATDVPADMPPLLAKEVLKPETSFVIPPLAPIPNTGTSTSALPPTPQPAIAPLTPVAPLAPPQTDASFAIAPLQIPPAKALPATPLPAPVTLDKLQTPKIEREFAPAVEPQVSAAPTPLPTPQPLEKLAAPKIERELAPYTPPPIPLREAPVLAAPATLAPAPTPAPEPATVFVPAAPSLERLTAPKLEREFVPSVEVKRDAPVVPAAAPAAAATAAPAASQAAPSATTATTTPTPSSAATPAPTSTLRPGESNITSPREGPAAPPGASTQPGAASSGASTPPTLGPAPATPAGPKIDLDAVRSRAREIASEGSGPRTLFAFPTVPKEAPKKSIEKIFDKALQRPDCKDAYADMGLAAVVPLIRDTIKNDKCKW